MTDSTLTDPTPTDPTPTGTTGDTDKAELYRRLLEDARSLLDGIRDPVTLQATAAALVHQRLPWASWTGFYRVVAPDLLRVGPYQGPVGCLEIPFGRGVCGTAAARRETQVVEDVHAFPGHIACDPDSRSEIVVPVDDAGGELFAVLDLDSHQPAAFDEQDRQGLEALASLMAAGLAAT